MKKVKVLLDEELVTAVHAARCFSCGGMPYEVCPRWSEHPCGREHQGGTRAATETYVRAEVKR